jgi:hypothetical protein
MKTVWVVWVYIALYALLLGLQLIVDFALPIEGATWALFFVVGGYTGMDEFASYVTTKKLPQGQKYTGSYKKLMQIVIAMFALVILAVVVQAISPKYPMPLDNLTMAAGLVAGIFAGGNKALNAVEKEGP